MSLSNINIDFSPLLNNLGSDAWISILWQALLYIGGPIILILILIALWQIRLIHIRTKFAKSVEYVLLLVSVPRENDQGPEAAERMFASLAGSRFKGGKILRYIQGYFQLSFSLELISVEGQIKYFVRTPTRYRELVEASIYSTYPDAEIIESEDYTSSAPLKFPDDEYDCWATDLVLYNKDAYPIRIYKEFETFLNKDLNKDPLTPLLETLSKVKLGEQVWFQLIITPISDGWKEGSRKLVKKIMGIKTATSKTNWFLGLLQFVAGMFSSTQTTVEKKEERPVNLTPGDRVVIEAIQKKASKLGFAVKFRFVYLAKKDVISLTRGIAGTLGGINQFNTLDMNGFKPDSRASTNRPLIFGASTMARKQNIMMRAYKNRNPIIGARQFILNIEELASIYHFPVALVKAPLIQKAGSKKGEPPLNLPVV